MSVRVRDVNLPVNSVDHVELFIVLSNAVQRLPKIRFLLVCSTTKRSINMGQNGEKMGTLGLIFLIFPPPFFWADAPKFVTKPVDVSGERGQKVNLVCVVDGNPPPKYTWFKNADMNKVRERERETT